MGMECQNMIKVYDVNTIKRRDLILRRTIFLTKR